MNDFYVYCMLDPRKSGIYKYGKYEFSFEPFYVGKGRKYRIKVHFYPSHLKQTCRKNSKLKKIISLGLSPLIIKITKNLSEKEALEEEIGAIKTIGRIDLKKGPLTNMTDGGDGVSGRIDSIETRLKRSNSLKGRRPWNKDIQYSDPIKKRMSQTAISCGCGKHMKDKKLSEETKRKISEANKGRIVSPETRIKIGVKHKGKIISENTRQKLSLANLGKKLSEETKRKISLSNKGKTCKPWNEISRNKLSESLKKYYNIHPKQSDGPLHGSIRAASRLKIPLEEYISKTSAGLRRCSVCKEWKTIDSFHRNGNKTYLRCKICRKIKNHDMSFSGQESSPYIIP